MQSVYGPAHAVWHHIRTKYSDWGGARAPPQSLKSFDEKHLQNRDGWIRTRDPLNPIRVQGLTNYDILTAFIGKPSVGAGVSRQECRPLPGETGIETGIRNGQRP